MSKYFSGMALIASIFLFLFQTFIFTSSREQALCAAAGFVVYGLAIARIRFRIGFPSYAVTLSWAAVSGLILGVLPPRMRLVDIHLFVLFFPLVHALLLGMFFHLASTASKKISTYRD